jgi:predicted restriction endonuclease
MSYYLCVDFKGRILMVKLTEQLVEQLKSRHYIRKANSSTYWFGFELSKINEFKREYEDDFYIILYQNRNDFNYYAIPYSIIRFILKTNNMDNLDNRKRWSGHIKDNILNIKNETLEIANYYNLDIKEEAIFNNSQTIPASITPIEAEASLLPEGSKKTIFVNKYERNPEARRKCIEYYGTVCQICSFNFKDFYGDLGDGFIEVHHKKPIFEIGETYEVDPIKDMIPVCSNCHSMLHRKRDVTVDLEDLREIVKKQMVKRI